MFSFKNQTGLQDKVAAPQTKTDLSDWALLIIDMQDTYLNGVETEKLNKLVSAQLNFLFNPLIKNMDIFLIEYKNEGKTADYIMDSLKKIKSNIKDYTFQKESPNAFGNQDLYYALEQLKKKNLIVMGVNATGCVLETARNALYYKFKVFTSDDLIEDEGWIRGEGFSNPKLGFYPQETSYFENYKLLLNAISQKT